MLACNSHGRQCHLPDGPPVKETRGITEVAGER